MEIQWKHVFLAFIVVLLLINLPSILGAVSEVISGFSAVITLGLREASNIHPVRGFQTFAVIKFLVLVVFLVAILRLIKGSNKK